MSSFHFSNATKTTDGFWNHSPEKIPRRTKSI